VQRDCETVGITRFGQQFSRAFGIERLGFQDCAHAEEASARAAPRAAQAVHHALDDRVAIDALETALRTRILNGLRSSGLPAYR
jgi:hypothetical protein